MSTKITPKVKNNVWQDYTKNSNSKNELKQIFLGMNPTNSYRKISLKLKKKLDQVKVSSSPPRKTLRPKIPKIKSTKKSSLGHNGTIRSSPKKKSPNSPKRSSPKRRISSPKRRISSPSKSKLVRSPSRRSNKDKSSSARLIKS